MGAWQQCKLCNATLTAVHACDTKKTESENGAASTAWLFRLKNDQAWGEAHGGLCDEGQGRYRPLAGSGPDRRGDRRGLGARCDRQRTSVAELRLDPGNDGGVAVRRG